MTFLLGLLLGGTAGLRAAVAADGGARRRRRAPDARAGRRTRRSSSSRWSTAISRIVLFEGLGLARAGWQRRRARRPHDRRGAAGRARRGAHRLRAMTALAGRGGHVRVGRASAAELMFRIDVMPFGEGDEITHAVADVPRHRRRARAPALPRGAGPSSFRRRSRSSVSACASPTRAASAPVFDGTDTDGRAPVSARVVRALRAPSSRRDAIRPARGAAAARAARRGRAGRRGPGGWGRALLESGGPVMSADGRRLGAVVVNADLTAFRDAEGRLRDSEERHRRALESMSDCVFETDQIGRWTHLSETWTDATGRRRGLPLHRQHGSSSTPRIAPSTRAPSRRC